MENLVASFDKYRDCYDRKSKALPLKVHDYCMLLNPLIITEHERTGKLQSKFALMKTSVTKNLPTLDYQSNYCWKYTEFSYKAEN